MKRIPSIVSRLSAIGATFGVGLAICTSAGCELPDARSMSCDRGASVSIRGYDLCVQRDAVADDCPADMPAAFGAGDLTICAESDDLTPAEISAAADEGRRILDDNDHHGEHDAGDDHGGHGELEPGDDNGGHGELEPGDDNGGHGELEPGDGNGGHGEDDGEDDED